MNVPMQDQRGPEFGAFTLGILADLKTVFRTTTGQVMLFPGSGSGCGMSLLVLKKELDFFFKLFPFLSLGKDLSL